ncbi:RNA polymerase sigma factor [Chitinophaga agri]|uniref:Sigma-70 family RNA polymerase sigma factor n=1 Tax=Chitinophaga agri TaxID=2703787 RepID=A0A6B9ZQL8_9BACT|nr:sigma-70 family RNA polymerase sigma factor [Chitinophaga agri]QHS63343.1 sigma-70 family RNA polymerase sigma factor [Chitinophaga agri]
MNDFIHTDTDQQLLSLIKNGSETAFQQLFQRHWEKLYTTASKKLGDQELARELVHDLFLDLWRRRQELAIMNLPAYLGKALQYRIINKLIAKKDEFFFELLDNTEESLYKADQALLEKDLTALIISWAEVLPERRRQIFIQYYLHHLTTQEIADNLQLSRKTVQNQLSISIQDLKAHFGHLLILLVLLDDTL